MMLLRLNIMTVAKQIPTLSFQDSIISSHRPSVAPDLKARASTLFRRSLKLCVLNIPFQFTAI